MEQNIKSIVQMARGAIELTITLELSPDDERSTISVSATAKSALAPTNPVATALYVGRTNGEIQAVEMTAQIPGQTDVFGGEQEAPAQLKLVVNK